MADLITLGVVALLTLAMMIFVWWSTKRRIMIIRLEALQSISNQELREKTLEIFLSTKEGRNALKDQERQKARNIKNF